MPEKRPNVFKTQESVSKISEVNDIPEIPEEVIKAKPIVDESYTEKSRQEAEQIYLRSKPQEPVSPDKSLEIDISHGLDEMQKRTQKQIRLRDEMLKKNMEQTENYQKQFEKAEQRPKTEPQKVILKSDNKLPLKVSNINMSTIDPYIQQLSQPQFNNTSYDVLPLPSEGKLYRNKKSSVKVTYLNTADENILTSPNLLQSGEFLEILINRKLLEHDLRYRDLHMGDRNALMLWLRATSYGEMYPVTVFDEEGNPFEAEVDLSTLKTKKLGAEPDAEGLFDFVLPVSKKNIKFRLLNMGDVDDIEKLVEEDTNNKIPVNNQKTYILERQLIEVDGDRNSDIIKYFTQNMRIKDASELRNYIDSIESGVDLNVEIKTPRGGSIKTFLPLNFRFFWPELSV